MSEERATYEAEQRIAAQAQPHSTCGVCGGKKTITGVLVPLNAFTNEPFKPTTATIECPDHRPDEAAPQAAGPAQGDLAQWRDKMRELLGESVDRPAFFNHLAVLERILAAMPAPDVNAELLGALRRCELAMDVLNGDTGTKSRPCSFCRADVYDGQVGIVHHKECSILGARAAIAQAEGAAG